MKFKIGSANLWNHKKSWVSSTFADGLQIDRQHYGNKARQYDPSIPKRDALTHREKLQVCLHRISLPRKTVARKSSMGVFTLAQGARYSNIWQKLHNLYCFKFQFRGGLELYLGGLSPPKPTEATGLLTRTAFIPFCDDSHCTYPYFCMKTPQGWPNGILSQIVLLDAHRKISKRVALYCK